MNARHQESSNKGLSGRRAEWIVGVVYRLIWYSIVLSAINLLPTVNWLHEINVNASHYYLAAHLIALFFIPWVVWHRSLRKAILQGLCLLALANWYLIQFKPFLLDSSEEGVVVNRPSERKEDGVIRLLYANVLGHNPSYSALTELVNRYDPDLVALVEVNQEWFDGVALDKRYPAVRAVLRTDNFGLALYSRFPFVGEPLTSVGAGVPPVILASLDIEGRQLQVGVLHAVPPESDRALLIDRVLFRRFASQFRHSNGDVLVVGDFNATPISVAYRRFRQAGRLENAWAGLGFPRTWNALWPGVYFMIDHIFYKGTIRRRALAMLPSIGSDHLPMLFDFEIGERQ